MLIAALNELLDRVESAAGPDRELDADLVWELVLKDDDKRVFDGVRHVTAGWHVDHGTTFAPYKEQFDGFHLTASIDAAYKLLHRVLPDFWITSGLCSLTGHASIGPDYNGPAGERLRQEWDEVRFHNGFDADLGPGDGVHRTCRAILSCILQAMIAREEMTP